MSNNDAEGDKLKKTDIKRYIKIESEIGEIKKRLNKVEVRSRHSMSILFGLGKLLVDEKKISENQWNKVKDAIKKEE